MKYEKLLKVLVLLCISGLACPRLTYALGIEVGAAAVEEGDDSLRPAAAVNFQMTGFQAHFFAYGRDFGPVKQRTYVLNLAKTFGLPLAKSIESSIGLGLLYDATKIKNDKVPTYGGTSPATNLGLCGGVYWVPLSGALTLRLGWEFSLFPAGVNGGLFLVTGRKQFLFLSIGSNV